MWYYNIILRSCPLHQHLLSSFKLSTIVSKPRFGDTHAQRRTFTCPHSVLRYLFAGTSTDVLPGCVSLDMSHTKYSNCSANKSSNDLILHHNNIMHKYDLQRDMHWGRRIQAKERLKCGWCTTKVNCREVNRIARQTLRDQFSGLVEICMRRGRGLSLGSGRMACHPLRQTARVIE